MNMRLFFSIEIPDPLCDALVEQRNVVKRACFSEEQLKRMRWIHERQYHVTQYFIGNVPEDMLDALSNIATDVCANFPSFDLTADALEFKPRRNPRLLWLRFHENKTFTALMHALHETLFAAGISHQPAPHEPIPHVTLIRLKQVKPTCDSLPATTQHRMSATNIDLIQSITKPSVLNTRVSGGSI